MKTHLEDTEMRFRKSDEENTDTQQKVLPMKGIILAGDSGRRLHPLTLGIPKHLLPVYDKPMIYYPIEMLVQAGITDILVVTTSGHQPLFRKAIGDGGFSGARFAYAVQEEAGGIAQAINIAAEFIGRDDACLITGDTVIDGRDVGRYLSKAVYCRQKR